MDDDEEDEQPREFARGYPFAVDFFPEALRRQVTESDTQRFDALVAALLDDWTAHSGAQPAARVERSLQWVSLVYCHLRMRGAYRRVTLEKLAVHLYGVVTGSCAAGHTFGQVRWASVLTRLLNTHKRLLRLSLDWRPLVEVLATTQLRDDGGYQGTALRMAHLEAVLGLVRASRRFFPPGSAADIWAHCQPGLRDTAGGADDAIHAAGWLALLLPCTHVGLEDGHGTAWGDMATQMVDRLAQVPNSAMWTGLWLTLLSRLAKHDSRARIPWSSLRPAICTAALACFELPIGGTSVSAPFSRRIPGEVLMLFMFDAKPAAGCTAKIILYTLGGTDPGMQRCLDVLVGSLCHYAHPSNGGAWTHSLAKFLRSATSHLAKRRAAEASGPGTLGRPCLDGAATAAVVASLMSLASRAQFSKSSDLASAASSCLASLAYIAPAAALPLVVARFGSALEEVTATHQLPNALTSLALCVRPLLAAPPAALGDLASQLGGQGEDAARALVAQALYGCLPGLDANDPPKTMAAVRFFAATLSTLPGWLAEEGDADAQPRAPLPVDWPSWTDELLSRLFALLSALEEGATAGLHAADNGTFLAGSDSFKPLCDLLFARLSPSLRLRAARRVAALASEAALPGVAHELTVLLSAACGGLTAQQAADVVLQPLLRSLASELEHVAGAVHLAASREALLCARAHRVPLSRGDAAVLCRSGVEGVLGHLWRLATATKSNALLDAASSLLMGLLGALLTPWPGHCHAPEAAAGPEEMDTGKGGWRAHCVAAWTPGSSSSGGGQESLPPQTGITWNVPGPEALAFANDLVSTYGLAPARLLVSAAAGEALPGSTPPPSKEQVRCWVMQMDAVLTGCQSCLPPAGDASPLGAPHGVLSPWAGLGITVGGGAQARGTLCAGLAAACTVVGPDDADSLAATLHAAEEALCPGNTEYAESNQDAAGLRGDAVYCSQPRNGPQALCPGDTHADQGKATRRRRPLWLVISQAQANMKWRASQAAFFQCGGPPQLTSAPQPGSGAASLLATVRGLCSSRYKAVREAACGVLEQVLKRHPAVSKATVEPFLEALGSGSSHADGTGEEVPLGAVSVLCTRSSTRLAASDEGVRAALLSALLASSKHQGPRAQSSIQDLFLVMAIRFVRLHPGQLEAHQPLGALRLRLLTSASAPSSTQDGGPAPTHWRFQLMATACVAFMLVPGAETEEQLRQLVPYFGTALVSDVAPLRPLGAAALLALLRGARGQAGAHPQAAEACNAAVAALLASPGYIARLCTQFALSHAVPDAAGGGGGSGGGHTALSGGLGGSSSLSGGSSAGRPAYSTFSGDTFLSSGDALWRAVAANVVVRDWTPYKWSSSAPKGIFAPLHAALFSDLAAAAPSHLLPALQQPLTTVMGQAGDRAGRVLAAEALAGAFYACGSSGSSSDVHTAFLAWAAPAFVRAALEAPAEARGDWIMAAAFAVGGGAQGRAAVLAALAAPPPATAAAGAHARRLLLLRHALAAAMHAVKAAKLDVQDAGATGAHDADVACVASTAAAVLAECTTLHDAPLRAVRDGAAALSAMLLALAAVQPCVDPGAEMPLPPDVTLLFPSSGVACVRAQAAFHAALAPPAAQFLTALPERAAAAADGVLAAQPPPAAADGLPPLPAFNVSSGSGGSGPSVGTGTPSGGGGAVTASSADMARMESFLKLVSSLIRNGDVAVGVVSQRLVVPLLPAMLRVQRTRDPEFDTLAQRALGHLKLARLPADALHSAVGAIMAAAADEGAGAATPWHARHAALVTLPYITSKHTFLWPPATVAAVIECVVARLADPRLEVRQAAAATLAGLIQGPACEDAPALRARFLAAAKAGAAAALGPNPGAIKEPVASVHARVLALSACILASPYDTPAWLPPLVVALAAYSTCPLPPVRSSVLLTFAEFKRTHADTWAETKAAFGEEAWDKASQGLELSPSYFC